MKASACIGKRGIPDGWTLVSEEAVENYPHKGNFGALIRKDETGEYALFRAGVGMWKFPKSTGNVIAGVKNENWGGARAGAGRPKSNRTAVCWRLSEDEKEYLRKCLENYRAGKNK